MNENEVMVNEEVTTESQVSEEQNTQMSTGLAMLIGAGLALAGAKAFKAVKKVYNNRKALREAAKTEQDSKVIDITGEVEEDEAE